MDNDLTIQLRVLSAGVEKITQASGAVDKLNKSVITASGGGISKFGKSLESLGSRINVLGQRMTWMVSVPLLAFGNKAIDTAVEIETAWTRFRKVFSGTEEDVIKLQATAVNLSNTFGKPVEEISNVMAEFNKAGITSVSELEKLGKAVLETSIIFDTDMTKALDGTKAVMMGFNLTAEDTEKALAAINIIADKTTASEEGILEVFNRAAGTARQAGFSFTELAASQAAFEKNAIPAGRAGNAMKSILVSLTKQSNIAKDQFKELGIDMSSVAWRTGNAGDKLKILSQKLLEVKNSGDKVKLADLNEAMASLVGKFQVNNLNVLLEDMSYEFDNNADSVSQFYDGLKVASDETENLKFKNQQLQKVLESSPVKLEIMNQMYRNQQAIIGNELLPIKMKLLKTLTNLVEKFNNLSPTTQQWIIYIGLAIAVLGPLLSFVGLLTSGIGFLVTSITTLVTWLGTAGSSLATMTTSIGAATGATTTLTAALSGGLVIAFAAVAAVLVIKAIVAFKDLNKTLDDTRKQLEVNRVNLDNLQQRVGTLSTKNANDQLQNAINKSKQADEATRKLTERYSGLKGVLMAVGDQFSDWATKAYDAMEKVYKKAKDIDSGGGSVYSKLKKLFSSGGGIVPQFLNTGGLVYAANGFQPKGTDTVPAMLTPGEMVLNKGQQSTLFDMLSGRVQQKSGGGATVNINVGTMVATKGEQRAFARQIQELLNQNLARSY